MTLRIIAISLICLSVFDDVSAQVIRDFSLSDLDGEEIQISDIKGDKVTIIDFWATWCKPCTKAMPYLDKIHKKYQEDGLAVIGISCDGPRSTAKVKPLTQSLGIDYHILQDIDCEVMNRYGYEAFPTLLILDKNNRVKWVHEGFVSGDEEEIEEVVRQYLN